MDVFQIGARNMQNFELLKEAGRTDKPILLKRGLSATIEEFIYAENILLHKVTEILFYVREVFVHTKSN